MKLGIALQYYYEVAPKGYLASGDAYTRRYNEITIDIHRKTKFKILHKPLFYLFTLTLLCSFPNFRGKVK